MKAIASGEAEPKGFAPFDEDGGPGSGNHGHKGVEGQVGGSAPSGDNPLTTRGPIKDRLKKLGHSQESIDRARTLFEKHSGNSGSDQAEADAEIAKHISDDDDIGKMLKDKAQMESQVWRDQIADANVKAKQHYEEELDDIRRMIQPGGALSNYTEDDLKDLGMWPKEPEATEPKFYRKGGMDKDVLAFTTDPNGANMSHLTSGVSGSIGSDQQFTLDQMKEMGYLPIAGIQSMDVGQVGESEVLFAKFPSSQAQVAPYAGETSHGLDESVYSAKKSEWSKNAGRALSDGEVQEMVDAVSDYTRNYKDVVAASAGYSGVYASRGELMDKEEKEAAGKSAEAIEKAISLSDKYTGTTKRAMTMDKDTFDRFVTEASNGGSFGLGHLSSWSTGDDALKRVFRSRDADDADSYNVVLECKSKSGAPIKEIADVDMDEVLYSKNARFKTTGVDPDYNVGKYKAVKLTLEETDRTDSNEKTVDSEEKTLDFSTPADTIKSKGITKDGAPNGNDNAAGPHKRSHLSSSDKARYRNRIVGQKTSDGVQVKGFSDHAFDRIAQRNLSPKRIEDMLRSQNVSPDKTYQNRRCYDVKGSRLVLDHTTGTIVTIEWRKQNR